MPRLVTTLALVASSLLTGCDCRCDWPPAPPPEQLPASMYLRFKTAAIKAENRQCSGSTTATIRWEGRLEGAKSGTGQTSFARSTTQEKQADITDCTYTFETVVPDLHPGTWTVSASTGGTILSCKTNVAAGAQTLVALSVDEGGC